MRKTVFAAALAAVLLTGCVETLQPQQTAQAAPQSDSQTQASRFKATTTAGAFAEQVMPYLISKVKVDVLQPRPVKAEDFKGIGYRVKPDEKTYRYLIVPVRFSYTPEFMTALGKSLDNLATMKPDVKPEAEIPFSVRIYNCNAQYCGIADMLDTAVQAKAYKLDDSKKEVGGYFNPAVLRPEVRFEFADKDGQSVVTDSVTGYAADGERVYLPLPVHGYIQDGNGGRINALPLLLTLGKDRSLSIYDKSEVNFLVALKRDEIKRVARIGVSVK